MLRIGLIGLGHLGKIHLKCIKENVDVDFVGIMDADPTLTQQLAEEHQLKAYSDYNSLLDDVDAIDIVTPTITHFELAKKAIERGKHCFIEKPVTNTLEEAYQLLELQKIHKVKVQIGHVERYNPAFVSANMYFNKPKFIEAHRLSQFKPRGTDVSVVHDLMIHDLDLISYIAKSEIKSIHASGVAIVSPTADICNARVEYQNGLVANITSSRISLKTMRKIRIFQEDAYMSLDLQSKEAEIYTMSDQQSDTAIEIDTYKGKKYISQVAINVVQMNAIFEEIKSFSESIVNDRETEVNLRDGVRALELVDAILQQIETKHD